MLFGNSYGVCLKKRFGVKVRKVPISLSGFTCPNIDGKVAKGGCVYCDNTSFSPNLEASGGKFFLSDNTEENILLEKQLSELTNQYRRTSDFFKKRYGAKKFIIYFQSFTNTYAPLDTLKKIYKEAVKKKDVVGLSIGTRADCVSDELLDYLAELNKFKYVTIEFGVQSIYDSTLKKINRGETFAQMEKVIKKTKERGLDVCVHLIFGLPGEDKEMMLTSVQKICELNVDSIKIHPLYVVKNTLLERSLKKEIYKPLSEEEYLDVVTESIKLIPTNISIQRITAGIDDDSLLEPEWCKDKNTLINSIRKRLGKKL